jgi:hypothetical protein
MMAEQWQPVGDGEYVHDSIIDGRIVMRVDDGGNEIAISDTNYSERITLWPFKFRLCRRVDAPQPLDMPDGPGWWAWANDIDADDRFVAHLQIFEVVGNEVEYKYDNSGKDISTVDNFRAMYPGKWTRLQMPWDAQEANDEA